MTETKHDAQEPMNVTAEPAANKREKLAELAKAERDAVSGKPATAIENFQHHKRKNKKSAVEKSDVKKSL